MFYDALLFREGFLYGILHWLLLGIVVFLVLALVLLCYQEINVKINTAEIVEENIFATVVEKDYDPSYTTFIRAGKVMTPVHHSSSYDVYLKYGDEEFAIDDEALYNRVNKNDKIPAKLVKYLSKDGKVLKIDIEVEEGS